MAKTKPSATASPARAAKKPDLLKAMLADVNDKLRLIGELLVEMQAHGDLRDDHIDLARSARKSAKRTHQELKGIRKGK